MLSTTVSAIAFDIGNVLVKIYHGKTRAALAEFAGVSEEDVREKIFGALHDEVERGLMTPETFRTRASELLGKDIPFPFFQHAWCDVFEENREIIPILEKLAQKHRLLLISNTDPLHFAHLQSLEVISRFFTDPLRRVLSFEAGARKPEAAIYRELITKTGVAVENILYIDDTLEFCDTFLTMGGNAINYNAKNENTDSLVARLASFGITN